MRIHLYRPYMPWRRGTGYTHAAELHEGEAAVLIGLRFATILSHSGDVMTDRSTKLQLVTPPSAEPVTLAAAKQFLRIEHAAEDSAVTSAISAARQAAEQYMRLALLPQAWELTVASPGAMIVLPLGPATGIESVVATNAAGEETEIEDFTLSVDGKSLRFDAAGCWEQLVVTYNAAFATDAEAVPALIKQGILHHVAVMLEHRQGDTPMPMQSVACYRPYREMSL